MLLSAAIVPPLEAREELCELARTAGSLAPGMGGPLTPDQVRLRVTTFGNLTPGDANRVVDSIRGLMAGWTSLPVVRFSRLHVDADGRVLVWMDGQVEELLALTRGVPRAVQGLGLYVDRRLFWPGFEIGRLPADVDPASLTGPLEPLADWVGEEWEVPGVSVQRGRAAATGTAFEELALLSA